MNGIAVAWRVGGRRASTLSIGYLLNDYEMVESSVDELSLGGCKMGVAGLGKADFEFFFGRKAEMANIQPYSTILPQLRFKMCM